MIKQLREHEQFITVETKRLTDGSKIDPQALYNYHTDMVRNFQHERLIHLLVTFFFGSLLLGCVFALLWPAPVIYTAPILQLLLLTITILLSITELFYIWHYYRLENGTQRLYRLSKQLHGLLVKK